MNDSLSVWITRNLGCPVNPKAREKSTEHAGVIQLECTCFQIEVGIHSGRTSGIRGLERRTRSVLDVIPGSHISLSVEFFRHWADLVAYDFHCLSFFAGEGFP